MKTLQMAGHDEDQQLPNQPAPVQQLEPPQQQPHQHLQMQTHQTATSEVISIALPMDKLTLNEQWAETNQLTKMAACWSNHSHSTPILSAVMHEGNWQNRHQAAQSQNDIRYANGLEFYPLQVMGNGRFHNLHHIMIQVLTLIMHWKLTLYSNS